MATSNSLRKETVSLLRSRYVAVSAALSLLMLNYPQVLKAQITFNAQPTDQSARPGDVILFECSSTSITGQPTWRIDSTLYTRSSLPEGHWLNSTGLVVQVREDMNGHQYQCQLINLETSGGSISVSTLTSEPATLTVEQTGAMVPVNYHKGITVSSLTYSYADDILTLDRATTGSYQLYVTTCDESMKLQSMVNSSCLNSLIQVEGLRNTIGSSKFLVDVRSCDGDGACEFAPPTGALVDSQMLVQVDLTNNNTSPNGERVVQFTFNTCFLQSKLWTTCSYTGLRIAVSGDTKTLNYSVFNDLETIKGHYFRFAYDNTADPRAGGTICTKSLNLIRQEFSSENYIYIQEYCTDTSECGSQLATSFGDRIRMDLVPVNSVPAPSACNQQLEIVSSSVPMLTTSFTYPTSTMLVSSTGVVTDPTSDPIAPNPLPLGGITGIAIGGIVLIALILIIIVAIVGCWRLKHKKSENALTAGRRIQEPNDSSTYASRGGIDALAVQLKRQSVLYNHSPAMSQRSDDRLGNSYAKVNIRSSGLFAVVESPKSPGDPYHSRQSSVSFVSHSRDPSYDPFAPVSTPAPPLAFMEQSPNHTLPAPPPPQMIPPSPGATQTQIPWASIQGGMQTSYVYAEISPRKTSTPLNSPQMSGQMSPVSLASTVIHDQEGHAIPPRPLAPSPPSLQSMNLADRPNSAQAAPLMAPMYRNPPSYSVGLNANTLPRPQKANSNHQHQTSMPGQDNSYAWNV